MFTGKKITQHYSKYYERKKEDLNSNEKWGM
jgi:hypothetical protein